MISVPEWVKRIPQGNKPLSPRDYYLCFDDALRIMSKLVNADGYQLNQNQRDERIDNDEAAKDDFYSSFQYRKRKGAITVVYIVTSAFFEYSYEGLEFPTEAKHDHAVESDTDYLKDCATNYLVKNFMHNHVHESVQGIDSANYHDFRGESRYATDFDADNFANILLALAYSHSVQADDSNQTTINEDLAQLFERNRCNRVFLLRDLARYPIPKDPRTIEDLQEREWLIRRRFANRISTKLIVGNRAAASLSIHFYGDIVKQKSGVFRRPRTQASVEINGYRFALGSLGNVTDSSREELNRAIEDLTAAIDTMYSRQLREKPALKDYAKTSLQARLRYLAKRTMTGRLTK